MSVRAGEEELLVSVVTRVGLQLAEVSRVLSRPAKPDKNKWIGCLPAVLRNNKYRIL